MAYSEVIEQAATGADPGVYCQWTALDGSATVTMRADVVERIRRSVLDAFLSLPKRGIETGGLLFGSVESVEPPSIRIEAFEPIACEHRFGPSFVLSANDRQVFQKQIVTRRPFGIVGYYRSCTGRELGLQESDEELARSLPPNLGIIALKPLSSRDCIAGYFFRQNGSLESDRRDPLVPFNSELGIRLAGLPAVSRERRTPTGTPAISLPPLPVSTPPTPHHEVSAPAFAPVAQTAPKPIPIIPPAPAPVNIRRAPLSILGEPVDAAHAVHTRRMRRDEYEPASNERSVRPWLTMLFCLLAVGAAATFPLWKPMVIPPAPQAVEPRQQRPAQNAPTQPSLTPESSKSQTPGQETNVPIESSPAPEESAAPPPTPAPSAVTPAEPEPPTAPPAKTPASAKEPESRPSPMNPSAEPAIEKAATPPVAVDRPAPIISPGIRSRIAGRVVIPVRVSVDARGKVTRAVPTEQPDGLNSYLAKRAAEAVQRWRFHPARSRDGRPIAGSASVLVEFGN